jgi:hypothetical protein
MTGPSTCLRTCQSFRLKVQERGLWTVQRAQTSAIAGRLCGQEVTGAVIERRALCSLGSHDGEYWAHGLPAPV